MKARNAIAGHKTCMHEKTHMKKPAPPKGNRPPRRLDWG